VAAFISDIGSKAKRQERENKYGRMEVYTKVIGRIAWPMESDD
jgi:hypothetical protein